MQTEPHIRAEQKDKKQSVTYVAVVKEIMTEV